MLTSPTDPARVLLEVDDIEHDLLPVEFAPYRAHLRTILDWARQYLTRPHESLGRKGSVCPFVQASIDRRKFYLTVYPGRPQDPVEVAAALLPYRDWFLELAPRTQPASQLTTILVLFPDLFPGDVDAMIDGSQDALKKDYVERGLMIGEFHDGPPDKGGLWNPDFRPLSSPVPLLAVRHMVPTDFPFLRDDRDHALAYLRQFASQVPATVREAMVHALVGGGVEVGSR
ncbi:FIG01131493: hypothetical protein [Alloactinosynnema sp. L-07]|uniref:DUF6875 domain-containing protein n=1 Tax=Alloactinosynnema sp. L-07 TaxID=1653480 RepID=UPI00065F04BC|nr:hypothetical protein [Alloactinosynnema sp. L-07]CRK62221.1 FIG01131493: hypothetical protein [Alloactinosynnema sp. L-07]